MSRKPQDLSKSFDTFTHEVQDFWRDRFATFTAWFSFMFLNVANVIIIIVSSTPSWGWTREVVGQGRGHGLEGDVYGHYGVWYTCYDSIAGYGRTCILWSEADYMPDWYQAFQAMLTLTFISGFSAFMLAGFYMFAKTLNRNLTLLGAFLVVDFLAIAFAISGFTVFCVLFLKDTYWCCHPDLNREMIHYGLDWGFILACVATGIYIIAFVAGIFEYMDIMKERRIEAEFTAWRQRESKLEFQHGYYPPPQNAAMMGYSNMWR